MDFGLVVELLIALVVIAVGYLIIARLIMPVVPQPMQAIGWAIIGILLLIALLGLGAQHWTGWSSHGVTVH